MTIRKTFTVLCISLFSLAPALASLADLQSLITSVSGSTITISLHNVGQQVEWAKVQTTVQLSDGSTETVTSSKIIVPAGGTVSITLAAGTTITGIIDDPEPVTVF